MDGELDEREVSMMHCIWLFIIKFSLYSNTLTHTLDTKIL